MTATISGDGTSTLINLTTSGNTILGDASTDTLNVGNGGLVKDASGNVGIGTSSPTTKLTVSYTGKQITLKAFEGTQNNTASIECARANFVDAASNLLFYTNSASSESERMRIDSSGNLLVGTTSQLYGERLNVTRGGSGNNVATFYFDTSDDRAAIIVRHAGASGATSRKQLAFLDSGGTERGSISSTGSATAYTTSSDYRLKENVEPMTGALEKVAALNPCTYTWKADGSTSEGFIAHELQAVVPDAVIGEKDAVDADGNPIHQGIDTSFLVATLTAAIQELKALVDTQASTITALQADVEALKAR